MSTMAEGVEARFRRLMREERESQGMSQQALCDALVDYGVDLDTSAITRLETGYRVIRLSDAICIARILGFSLDRTPDRRAVRRISRMSEELAALAASLEAE